MDHSNFTSVLANCIHACGYCASSCISEGSTELKRCILTDLDCADYCSMVLKASSRQSPLLRELLQGCIEICHACEKECESHEHDHCKKCAEACRECISVCEERLRSLQDT